ncbi:MAG TPA: phosphate acyltransferase [Kofleriaceae bacterium]|nr:phosphate acyltransferase [Kofleriaceae bacterium]
MLLEQLRADVSSVRPRVLFTDGEDDRVLAAVAELAATGAITPIVIGEPPAVRARGRALGVALDGVELVGEERLVPFAGEVERIAAHRGIEPHVAERMLRRPMYAAIERLASGSADAVVAGAGSHTDAVLLACALALDLAPGRQAPSSAFVLDLEPVPLVFADCAVTPSPSAEQLAEIAIDAAGAAASLLQVTPRVAMLSFSTHGSAHHPDVERVARATALVRARRPELAIDGELQADAALDARVAGLKQAGADAVAGRANVLVFPDLDAGNIGYKLVRTLVPARAYGVFVLGYPRPVVKLSRGSTVDEIVGTALLARRLLSTTA